MSDDPYYRILKALKTILDNYDATLEPVRRAPGAQVKGSKEPPLPISVHVLDIRAMTCSRLASWSLLVIDERDLHTEHLSGLDVFAMADLLTRHAEWLGKHEAGTVAAEELEASARDLAGIALDNRPRRFTVGLCPEHGTSELGERVPCEGELRVVLRRDDELMPSELRCSLDGEHRWSAREWMFLGRRVTEQLMA